MEDKKAVVQSYPKMLRLRGTPEGDRQLIASCAYEDRKERCAIEAHHRN
jgi:hypothetical protein